MVLCCGEPRGCPGALPEQLPVLQHVGTDAGQHLQARQLALARARPHCTAVRRRLSADRRRAGECQMSARDRNSCRMSILHDATARTCRSTSSRTRSRTTSPCSRPSAHRPPCRSSTRNFTVSPFNESEASGARQGLDRKVLSPFLRCECDKVGLQAKYFEQNGCVRLAKP